MNIALLMLMSITMTFAQDGPREKVDRKGRKDKIESKKIAFITESLDLSPEEAQRFWPVYNEYKGKMKEVRGDRSDRPKNNFDEMTDAEAEVAINENFDRQQRELDLKRVYYKKMADALSSKKVAKLIMVEKRFKNEVLSKVKRRMKRKNKEKGKMKER